jgi:cell wall-associated NlpC family hydrolase
MKVSYSWLKEYINSKLPDPKELADILDDHSYEVKGIDESGGDNVLDIEILPNRGADSLSHRGIAKEISAVAQVPFQDRVFDDIPAERSNLSVEVLNDKKCPRYIATVIKNVKVSGSPLWLVDRLKSIEQRSINSIVDTLNYVMFDMGQPMHAFDADKVSGKILIREATSQESILTLDNKEIELKERDLVIADDEGPLAIAGVKGGKRAEVTESTRNIILEAAHFNQGAVRGTSRRLNLITDASKRFENGVAPELASHGMKMAVDLINKLEGNGEMIVEESIDLYPRPRKQYRLGVSLSEINGLLGTEIKKEEVEDIWSRHGFSYTSLKPLEEVIKEAPKYVGVPYKYGASITYDAPDYFDCSSFTAFLFANAGVSIPRMTVDQFVHGEEIKENELKPGDIVFSQNSDPDAESSFDLIQQSFVGVTELGKTTQKEVHYVTREFMPGIELSQGVNHNGLYLGDGKIIHASGKWYKGEVVIEDLKESPAFREIRGIRRMTSEEERYVPKDKGGPDRRGGETLRS